MSSITSRSRWWFLVTPKWLGWHAFAVVATIGMLWLGDWQFHRAESGNALSWAYTFEWPIFAIFGVVFWAKTIRDEFKPPDEADAGEAAEVELPGGRAAVQRGTAGAGTGGEDQGDGADRDDPELAAYNAYLARLNEQVKGHGRWHGLR
jgi:DNA-binding transcriptional regulator of glucitol operon